MEKNIAAWKRQVGEYKQQILAEKKRKVERRNALKRAAVVQKQRAEHMKVAVENLISELKEKVSNNRSWGKWIEGVIGLPIAPY